MSKVVLSNGHEFELAKRCGEAHEERDDPDNPRITRRLAVRLGDIRRCGRRKRTIHRHGFLGFPLHSKYLYPLHGVTDIGCSADEQRYFEAGIWRMLHFMGSHGGVPWPQPQRARGPTTLSQ